MLQLLKFLVIKIVKIARRSKNKTSRGSRVNNGGDGEIRTHGGIAPTQPFQDCTLNRSDTSPHVLSLFIYYHEHKIYDNIFL